MAKHLPKCTKMAEACQLDVDACEPADTYCKLFETTRSILYMPRALLNPYDMRKPCGENPMCYDFSNIDTFLNLNSTRKALHVSDEVDTRESCNNGVNAMFMSDWMRNIQQVGCRADAYFLFV
jgi:cathepsin A (carboxypeptidase C)